ncbi:hypothetical protein GCM10009584_20630 [Ornithinimicrobium humiphilum]|uniref:helix-turn-helix domain-containing protein n=1 Tax=Ornithinimicrobium humiphilum TaxID=125288 RepID=UPI00114F7B21|nr:helix-turn-helix transcriptional regulator [Ornithinimicrobium humiphilum]
MSHVTDLKELLGIDPDSPEQQRADRIINAQGDLRRDLAAVREAAGVTVQDVSDRTGWSKGVVLGIENGTVDPSLSMMRRYCHAVGCIVTYTVVPPAT